MLLYKTQKIKKFQTGGGWNNKIDRVIYTQEDRDKSEFFTPNMIEDLPGACKGNACLLYNKGLAHIPGVKTTTDIENNRGVVTTPTAPTEEQIQKYPYFKGDGSMGSVDSWDIAGILAQNGTAFYNINDEKADFKNTDKAPVGTFFLWGPDEDEHTNGYSSTQGFKNSNHTMIKVGWDKDTGESVLMDGYDKKLYTVSQAAEKWSRYKLQTAIAPNENLNLNQEFFTKYFEENNKNLAVNVPNTFDKLRNNIELEKEFYKDTKADKYLTYDLQNFSKSLVDNSENLSRDLNLNREQYIKMSNFLAATSMNESKAGKSLHGALGSLAELAGSSTGMTQLNFDNILNDPKLASIAAKYGIYSKSDLRDPYKSGIASMIYLSALDKSSANWESKGNANPSIIKSHGATTLFSSPIKWLKNEVRGVPTKRRPDEYSNGYYVLPNGKNVKLNASSDEQNAILLKRAVEEYYPGKSHLYSYKDGEVIRQAEGNVELSPEERWATAWRSPGVLFRGDATKNKYVQKTMFNLNNYLKSQSVLTTGI